MTEGTNEAPAAEQTLPDPSEVRVMLARALAPYVRVDGDVDPLTSAVDAVAEFLVSDQVLTLLHRAVEDKLIDLRDSGIWLQGPANGLVVKTKEGYDSDAIRMGTRDGLRVALEDFGKKE